MRVGLRLCCSVLVLCAAPLGAQNAAPLAEVQPGARVRIEAPGVVAGHFVGTVLSRTVDSVHVGSQTSAPITLALSQITSLEVSRGNSRVGGMLRGLAWGAPLGLAFAAMATTSSCHSVCSVPDSRKLVRIFAVSGVVWGAGFGALIGHERWGPLQPVSR